MGHAEVAADLASSLKDFGVAVQWQGATVQGIGALTSTAEDLGLGTVWVTEAWGLEALSVIGYLLGRTSRIRIGAGVLNVYSRSAALIGMACATFEQMAPGRFVLGLGTSGRALIEDWHGARFEEPLRRTREYVEVLRKVSAGDVVDYEGKVLRLRRFRLFAQPARCRPPEVYIGAIGERNLRLAGEISDGAIVVHYPLSRLREAQDFVGPGKKIFAYYPLLITDGGQDRHLAARGLRRNVAFYVASMGKYYSASLIRMGYAEDVRRIKEANSRGGSGEAAAAVSEELMDELAFTGTAAGVKDKIDRRVPDGVSPVFAFSVASEKELWSAERSLRLLARAYGEERSARG